MTSWNKYKEGITFELYPNIEYKRVQFNNRFNNQLGAFIFYPEGFDENKKYPAIIVGHPHGGVKEQTAGLYAQEMATKGFVAMAFDNSYNGDSTGSVKRISSPEVFTEDSMAAVDFMGTRPYIDREKIGAIGVCASGGFMLHATAVDPRIKMIATVSMYDMGSYWRDWVGKDTNGILELLKNSSKKRWEDFSNGTVSYFDQFPLKMSEEEFEKEDIVWQRFLDYYATDRARFSQSHGGFTINSMASWINFRPFTNLNLLTDRPLLIIAGEVAHSLPFSEEAFKLAPEGNKELYIVKDATHVDLYDKKDIIPFAKLEEFFKNLNN